MDRRFLGLLVCLLIFTSCEKIKIRFHSDATPSNKVLNLKLKSETYLIRTDLPWLADQSVEIKDHTDLSAYDQSGDSWSLAAMYPTSEGSYYAGAYDAAANPKLYLGGSISLSSESYLLYNHNFNSDSTDLDVTIDSTPFVVTKDPSLLGWFPVELGAFPAGAHSVNINGRSSYPDYAYFNKIIAVPLIDKNDTINSLGWIEDDHQSVYKSADWSVNLTDTQFPYSHSTFTGTGESYSSSIGSKIYLYYNVEVSSTLRIWGRRGPGLGDLGVKINQVAMADFDQSAAQHESRAFKDYPLTPGKTLIELSVLSSSEVNVNAIEIKAQDYSETQRMQFMIDSIATNINEDGAMKIAHDSDLYNQDNDSGYALMALGLAVAEWNIKEHADAFKRGLQWFGDVVDSDGLWHWGYCKESDAQCLSRTPDPAKCRAGYCPTVNDEYINNYQITDIRSIDAPQSFPAIALAIYASLYPNDTTFINSLKPKVISGIEALIQNNYNADNGMFYSSYQLKNGVWTLYPIQYSAGQCDIYMGMMSAYALTKDKKYQTFAKRIKENFETLYYDSTRSLYSVALSDDGNGNFVKDTVDNYIFSQGWCSWVFGRNGGLQNSNAVLNKVATWGQITGSGALLIEKPLDTTPANSIVSYSAWLLLGLNEQTQASSDIIPLRKYLFENQFIFHPDLKYGHGSVYTSESERYLYSVNAVWAYLALKQERSPVTWWRE